MVHEKRTSMFPQEVDVTKLVRAKKNEMRISEENSLEITKLKKKEKKHKSKSKAYITGNNDEINSLEVPKLKKKKKHKSKSKAYVTGNSDELNSLEITNLKKKKKKHKSKSKDCVSENSDELNNTLSLGFHVNIALTNSADEKTVKSKSDVSKKQICAELANQNLLSKDSQKNKEKKNKKAVESENKYSEERQKVRSNNDETESLNVDSSHKHTGSTETLNEDGITETVSCDASQSPHKGKRKHKKHKESMVELEELDVSKKKRKKQREDDLVRPLEVQRKGKDKTEDVLEQSAQYSYETTDFSSTDFLKKSKKKRKHVHNEEKRKKTKSKHKEQERAEISIEMNLSHSAEIISEQRCTSQNVQPFGPSPMQRLLYGDPNSMVTETCTHCLHCSQHVSAKPSPVGNVVKQEVTQFQDSVKPTKPSPVVNPIKQEMTQLQDLVKPCVIEKIVNYIKKEPDVETSNSQVIEPIPLIDTNSIKQEPGLITPSDPVQLKLPKDDEQQVSTLDMLATHQELPHLKKEHVIEEHNSADGVTAVELQNTAEDTYVNSVRSEDGASEFFTQYNADNIAASEESANGNEGKTLSSANIQKGEADDVRGTTRYADTPQHRDLSKHALAREASSNSERSLGHYKQSSHKEEWIYELHMIDVPCWVRFHKIADYFKVPLSKVREYRGYGRRHGYKHIVVFLSDYRKCWEMKNRRPFGCRHTYVWSFKKYSY